MLKADGHAAPDRVARHQPEQRGGQREHKAEQSGNVLGQHHHQLGAAGAPQVVLEGAAPAFRCLQSAPQGPAFQADGDKQEGDGAD